MIAALLAQADASSLGPVAPIAVGTVTGMLVAFGWIFYKGMGRADRRVDEAYARRVAAAELDRDRAYSETKEARELWQSAERRRIESQLGAAAELISLRAELREARQTILELTRKDTTS